MLRFLLSAASIFVLLTATLFPRHTIAARRCPVKLPETLLSLYRSSEFIYVGKFDKVEEGEMTEDTEDYRVIPIRKHYSISSSLKGESRKMLVLEDSEYRYKTRETALDAEPDVEIRTDDAPEAEGEAGVESETETEAESEDGSDTDERELKPGDSVLLFLNKDIETDKLNLSDYRDGLKEMTLESLAAYELRIRELNAIFAAENPGYTEVIAWLVRCAEDPLTRWEGTYELLRSFQNLDWREEQAKEASQPQGDEPAGPARYMPPLPKKFDTGDLNFARELTETQKLILTGVLLDRGRSKNSSTTKESATSLEHGDRELIELVKRWGDSGVAAHLIEQLRYDSSDASLTSDLMSSVASVLGDSELTAIAERYADVRWESDGDEVEDSKEPEAATTDDPSGEDAETTDAAVAAAADVSVQKLDRSTDTETFLITDTSGSSDEANELTADQALEKEAAKKRTYGELRTEILGKFLARADKLLAPQSGETDDEN